MPDTNLVPLVSIDDPGDIKLFPVPAVPPYVVFAAEDKIFNFAWSKSGKRLAVAGGQQRRDAVLLSDFDN